MGSGMTELRLAIGYTLSLAALLFIGWYAAQWLLETRRSKGYQADITWEFIDEPKRTMPVTVRNTGTREFRVHHYQYGRRLSPAQILRESLGAEDLHHPSRAEGEQILGSWFDEPFLVCPGEARYFEVRPRALPSMITRVRVALHNELVLTSDTAGNYPKLTLVTQGDKEWMKKLALGPQPEEL